MDEAFHISGSPNVAFVSTWPSFSSGAYSGHVAVHFQPTAVAMFVISSMPGFTTSLQESHAIGVPASGCTSRDGK